MLARKYDNYAWEEQRSYVSEDIRQKKKENARRLLRQRIMLLAVCLLAFYLVSVMRSEAYISNSNTLVILKQQESDLITTNAELKIEVEKLKSSTRIAAIAQNNLGMQVARSNIYVQATTPKQNPYDGYAYAK
ncbi:MAG TPA: cell division protein FtsL [Candidatus Avacidaminococcus intestinavium]|uniref:Cell division protein FtsL n=1 Tax=Candidatus Avacidaminococcus intestinavium TaxID=2840684 RepID=A0A9D1MNU6_9FIRM|nr:cell division protein FtsL [Candidatus Avacidaminococcus intestinavium]